MYPSNITRTGIGTFIIVGLIVAFPGEFVNNFLVMDSVGNFIFAMLFYTLSLTSVFLLSKKFLDTVTITSFLTYALLTGIGLGLVLNEWVLVGNHPLNPSTRSILSQLSMIAYHSLLYAVPLAFTRILPAKIWINNLGRGAAAWLVFIVGVGQYIKGVSDAQFVLAWTIATTYFLGYLPMSIYFFQRVLRDIRTTT